MVYLLHLKGTGPRPKGWEKNGLSKNRISKLDPIPINNKIYDRVISLFILDLLHDSSNLK